VWGADRATLDLSNGMTLEAWVYPTTTRAWQTILFKENKSAGHEAYALYGPADGSKPATELGTATSYTTLTGSQSLPANTWSHIAATYDGATMKVYRNGTLVGSKALTGSLVNTTDPLKFGGNAVWNEWFQGRLDEVRVWKTARTQSQVTSDMNTAI
jgi:hypothetical protein